MILKTERLTLRPWRESDAGILFKYAKDERVGTVAGWPPHRSEEESLDVIRNIFSQDGVFAITLNGEDEAIGCVGVICGAKSNFPLPDSEGEISYWLGVPHWGVGIVPEAVKEIIGYAFGELGLKALWCGYFDGNEQSRKVQEKCGFVYHHTSPEVYCCATDRYKTEHVTCLTYEDWMSMK